MVDEPIVVALTGYVGRAARPKPEPEPEPEPEQVAEKQEVADDGE